MNQIPVILFYLFIFLVHNASYSQHSKINGKVLSSSNESIPYAQLVLSYSSEDSIVAHTIADSEGSYLMSIDGPCTSYSITASALGYLRQTKIISCESDHLTPTLLDFRLEEYTLILEEVRVFEKKPINIKEDTISYEVGFFIDQTEEVTEDVLKKIPGIQVTSSGKIKYQGKEIKKILLDGDDLTNENYQMISKNLSADLLKGIDIIKNHNDSRLLKSVQRTDDIALNLKLKDDRKAPLFGNLSPSIGVKSVYNTRVDLLTYSKKMKGAFFGNINNVGDDPVGSDYQRYNRSDFEYKQFQYTNRLVEPNKPTPSFPSRRSTTFHKAKYLSSNYIVKPNSRISIRGVFSLYKNNIDYNQNSIINYIYFNENQTLKTSAKQTSKPTDIYADVSFNYKINDQSDLDIRIKHNYSTTNVFVQESIDSSILSMGIDESSENYSGTIKHSKKIKNNFVWVNELAYMHDANKQYMIISNPFLSSAIFSSPEAASQKSPQTLNNLGAYSSLFGKIGSLEVNTGVGYVENHNSLNLALQQQKPESEISNSAISLNEKNLYWELFFRKKIKSLELWYNNRLRHVLRDSNNESETFVRYEPLIGLKNNWNNIFNTSIIYSKEYSFSTPSQLLNSNTITGLRAFSRSDLSIKNIFSSYTWLFSMKSGDGFSKRHISGYLELMKIKNPLSNSTNSFFDQNTLEDVYIVSNNESTLRLSSGISKYIPKLSSILKSTFDYINIDTPLQIEGQLTRVSNESQSIELSYGSAFSGIANFSLASKFEKSKTSNDQIDSQFRTIKFNEKLILNINHDIKITASSSQFRYMTSESKNKYDYIVNLDTKYQIKKNRLTASIVINNLLNNKQFEIKSNDQLSTSRISYYLLPRYILLKLSIRV